MIHWLDTTLYTGLPYAIITLSFVITFQYLRFPDVTAAGTFVLGGAVAALAIVHGNWNPYAAVAGAAAAGALGGCLTALAHIGLKIDKLLAGILAAFAIYSINLLILHPTIPYGARTTILTSWENLDQSFVFDPALPWHLVSIAYLAFVVFVIKFATDAFLVTELGLCLRAFEDEEAGSVVLDHAGVTTWKVKSLGLALGNALVAIAGAVVSMAEGAANAHRGFDVLITGLIAYLCGQKLRDWIRVPFRPASSMTPIYWQPAYTTVAIVGPLLFFGLTGAAHRLNIPAEFVKIVLAVLVALAIGDRSRLDFRQLFPRRNHRLSVPLAATESSGPSGGHAVALSNVCFTYGNRRLAPALSHATLALPRAVLVLLTGPNGSGKSTLMKLLAGRLPEPDSGTIVIWGEDVTWAPRRRRQLSSYMDQDARRELVATFSIEENLALAAFQGDVSVFRKALGKHRRTRVREAIINASLPIELLTARPGEVSGGQRQVLRLLSLCIQDSRPRVVLLDEPFNNLDAAFVDQCIATIRKLVAIGSTVLVVSHSHHDALSPDLAICIDNGRVLTSTRC